MYRPPSRPPVGKWARFLHRQRQKRGWSQVQAFEALREGLGWAPSSRASYQAIDMGDREPNEREQAYLVQFFGTTPEEDGETVPDPILALIAEIRAEREAREADAKARAEFDRGLVEAILELARAVAPPPDQAGNSD